MLFPRFVEQFPLHVGTSVPERGRLRAPGLESSLLVYCLMLVCRSDPPTEPRGPQPPPLHGHPVWGRKCGPSHAAAAAAFTRGTGEGRAGQVDGDVGGAEA